MAQPSTLIIDLHPESRDAMARIVTDAGHSVLTALSLPEGLALVSTLRPQVVLLDMDIPGTEPFELIQQIRLESTDSLIVALSSARDTAFVVRAMRTGASDFIVKPAAPGVIQEAVTSALARAEAQLAAEGVGGHPSDLEHQWPDLDLLFRNSQRMRAVETIVRRAADTNATILLQGESGTGKEMVAKAIHYVSRRRDKPFLKVNCASLPGELLESELFGHEKGAFTGAHRRKPGKFELAHRGTFLLDKIGEMPLGLQASLLNVLRDGKFFRVGGSELIDADVRLVAATDKDLASVMAAGLFREDLYYRLNAVTIAVPPLRERGEEIPVLVEHFLKQFCRQYDRELPRISPETMRLLQEYAWPGNVRELENMIKRLVVLQNDALLHEEIALRRGRAWSAPQPGPVPPQAPQPPRPPQPQSSPTNFEASLGLKEIAKRAALEAEKAVLKQVLDQVRWNRAAAARLLKISYKALLYKITAAGLGAKGERQPREK